MKRSRIVLLLAAIGPLSACDETASRAPQAQQECRADRGDSSVAVERGGFGETGRDCAVSS
jgi:hypothetical protein